MLLSEIGSHLACCIPANKWQDLSLAPVLGYSANLETIATIKSLQERANRFEETSNCLQETNKCLQEANKCLQETNKTLRETNGGMQQEIQNLVRRARVFEEQVRTLVTKAQLGETSREELETELKKVQDQVHATRDEHTITHDKLKAVTKKQEEDTHQITLLQRGSNCLEKVLGRRRFRQVVNGDRGEPNSAVLDPTSQEHWHSKSAVPHFLPSLISFELTFAAQMLAWFERMSLNEFKPEDIRWYFDSSKKKAST